MTQPVQFTSGLLFTMTGALSSPPDWPPTTGAVSSYTGDVEVVQPDAAAATITQFLGGPFGTITTPPLDAYGTPVTLTPPPTTTAPPTTPTTAASSPAKGTTPSAAPGTSAPSYDPTPC